MEWRTDEPLKDGAILAAVEEWDYNDYGWKPVAWVAVVLWYDSWYKCWALDDETSERGPTPVKFTKWMLFPEYPK